MSSPLCAYLDMILACPKLRPLITCHKVFEEVPAQYGVNRLPWSTAIVNLLNVRNIQLYSHQCLATDHIRAGHSVVVATPTASGKSLIYNLPVLDQVLRDPETRSLYLFPLKALAQDQLAALSDLCRLWPNEGRPTAAVYDGDTSDYMRRKIRKDSPNVLITNPEMLHLAILPYHQNWTTFLSNLTYIIVDEAHTYRGVFGSHMAQVFRRLNRIAARYGANPVYVFCTATLGNPGELAANLMGAQTPPVLINTSGAPQGKRHFLFFNPDQAASTCAIELLKLALSLGFRTIVYCRSRRMTELISVWAGSEAGEYQGKISSYRAGYLPEERRNIEARMASGELLAVVSTSALELGIDIGGLDICILVGYPGTVTQTLQRGGRVGRSGRESAVLLVAGEDAIDQYFVSHPDDFFSRPAEKATVNPCNEAILKRHLECAAAELPLHAAEPLLSFPSVRLAVSTLENEGLLARTATGEQWLAMRKRPQRNVDLRGSDASYTLENGNCHIVGTMDGYRVWKEAHPGAIYLHHGKIFIVKEIDPGRMRILLEPTHAGWFTRARVKKETVIIAEDERMSLGRTAIFRGRMRISEQVTGYERRAVSGNKLLTVIPLDAPVQTFETDGLWYVIPDTVRAAIENEFLHFMGSIHALEHAAIGLLPLEIMADRNDFGGISIPLHPQLGLPAVFIYDGLPGGAGLSTSAFPAGRRMLESTYKAIADCPCEDGCPSCIHSPKCGAGNRPLSKAGAIRLLQEMLAPGNDGETVCSKLAISPAPDFERLLPLSTVGGVAETSAIANIVPTNIVSVPLTASRPGPLKHELARHYVVFDVETRRSAADVGGWHRADKMGVSVAVLYDSVEDACFSYGEENLQQMFGRMAAADLVIGFNSIRFDYKVLEPFAESLSSGGLILRNLPTLDILQKLYERIHCRISLDNLCKTTLEAGKSSDGQQALRWWKEGNIAAIVEYCRTDVELTRELYLFGLREGYLLYTNKAGSKVRAPVDFSTR